MKLFIHTIYIHLLMFCRVKQALFFTFLFPMFIIILFQNIFGLSDKNYSNFILTGMITITLFSEGLFDLGETITAYFISGFSKILKNLPFNIYLHFLGIILSRFIILSFSICLLILISIIFFKLDLSLNEYIFIFIGSLIAFIIYSLIGIFFSLLSSKTSKSKNISNIIFYVGIFVSDAFFPLSYMNKKIGDIADFLPINMILNIMRNQQISFIVLLYFIIPLSLIIIVNSYKKLI